MRRLHPKKRKPTTKRELSKPVNLEGESKSSCDELSNYKLNSTKQAPKCYGYGKHKDRLLHSNYKESFALPDIPIFAASFQINQEQQLKKQRNFLKNKTCPSLDVELIINPCDLSVLEDLKLINEPWLVEYPEVITPYWDIECLLLLPVNYDNYIRKKVVADSLFFDDNEMQFKSNEDFYIYPMAESCERTKLDNAGNSLSSKTRKREKQNPINKIIQKQITSSKRVLRSQVSANNMYNINKNNLRDLSKTINESTSDSFDLFELQIARKDGEIVESENKVNSTKYIFPNEIKQELEEDYENNMQNTFITSHEHDILNADLHIMNNMRRIQYFKKERETLEYAIGNLVWARSSKYPFWPALICNDPISNNFFVEKPNNNSKHTKTLLYYHVRFFGDNGKRLWISKKNLMLYCNSNDLEVIAQKLKSEHCSHSTIKPYLIHGNSSTIRRKWHQAINEIESMRFKSFDTIYEFLLNSWTNYRLALMKTRRIKRKLQEENDNLKLSEAKSFEIDLANQQNDNKSLLTHNATIIKKEDLTTLTNQANNSREIIQEVKSESSAIISHQYSFEAQLELHRRNYLFSGFRGVKVCNYCLKPGNLFKCTGKCCLYFHLKCLDKKGVEQYKVINTETSVNNISKRNKQQAKIKQTDYAETEVEALGEIKEMSIIELIDYKMQEIMGKYDNSYSYYSSDDCEDVEMVLSSKNVKYRKELIEDGNIDTTELKSNTVQHITADSEFVKYPMHLQPKEDSSLFRSIVSPPLLDTTDLKCFYCRNDKQPPCFSCGKEIAKDGTLIRQKCSSYRCGKFYHFSCLKNEWYQTQWVISRNTTKKNNNGYNNRAWTINDQTKNEDEFICPSHKCQTCFSDHLGNHNSRLPGEKLARCLLCPSAFHSTTFCIPAGTEILGASQIICPKHRPKPTEPINAIWCFICSKGGNLVCCETCPTSIHPECQPTLSLTADDTYICEDCEFGRFPLYDEIVWVKLGKFKWWPALILFPNEIPIKIRAIKHQRGDFVVRFFGSNDHYWVNKARAFVYQDGDQDSDSPKDSSRYKSRVYKLFGKALEDAAIAYKFKKEFKLRKVAEGLNSLKPPPYVKINRNKPVGNVRKCLELNLSNAIACDCNPNETYPCGPDSNCINRLLLTECDSDICPAGTRCKNQSFELREYPPMVPYKTENRGWGLKCLAPIEKGQFIIEYVGELIDTEEYQRRINKMHEQKNENYYFMTMDADRMIDAGPKGNISRFMNHSCNPNCETQKWTVRGDTRVGLFAKCFIEAGCELTFNYNLEVVGQKKKPCYCGAINCSGFIGIKPPSQNAEAVLGNMVNPFSVHSTSKPKSRIKRKKKKNQTSFSLMEIPLCFICGGKDSILTCNNKLCNKSFHLNCLNLDDIPNEAAKFVCPRHSCNICSKRTIRFCMKCTNSFCAIHSTENIFYNQYNKGFLCNLHMNDINNQKSKPLDKSEQNDKKKSKIVCTDETIKRSVILKYFKLRTSINNFSIEEQEIIRQIWREQNQKKSERKKLIKLQKLENIKESANKNDKTKMDQPTSSRNNKFNIRSQSSSTLLTGKCSKHKNIANKLKIQLKKQRKQKLQKHDKSKLKKR